MQTISPMLKVPLDVFGQNPRLSRLYTQLCFCFPLSTSEDLRLQDTDSLQSSIVNLLRQGLERLSNAFMWTGGRVVSEGGIFHITYLSEPPNLIIKDLSAELPPMDQFQQAGFPFSMLNETIVSARNTLPERFDEDAPVFLLQANFITGGLLLVFSGQHNCMDMAGQVQIISLFAKACRGEPFTIEELSTGNLPRRNIIPLLSSTEVTETMSSPQVSLLSPKKNEKPISSPQSIWANIRFPASTLNALKAHAMTTLSSEISFISTDDVLSAFIWQSITRARFPRLSPTAISTFDRQVDVRKHLSIPATYTGNVVFKTSTSFTVHQITSEPLGILASALRSSLSPTPDLGYRLKAEAAALWKKQEQLQQSNSATTQETATARAAIPDTDVKMSSWAKEKCCEIEFGGILGTAEAVRRPRFEAWEGLAYLLPKSKDGEIVAAVCLRSEDLERLKDDEDFAQWGRWIG